MAKSTELTISGSNNAVPVGIKLSSDLTKLSRNIAKGQEELQDTLDELDTSSLEVTIERNFIGLVKKSSIEENLENVYSNLSYYIGKCGEALQNTNENLGRALDLIKLLALVEKDLYEHLDDQIVSNNELKSILLDWFKKQGINDNEVRELLESSFQRAYTLRDRLNLLRQEYLTSIANCERRVSEFEHRHNTLDSEIKNLISETTSKLQNALNEDLDLLSKLYTEKHSSMMSLASNQEKRMNDIVTSFVIAAKQDKERQESLRDSINTLFSSIQKLISSFEDDYKQKNLSLKQLTKESCDAISLLRSQSIDEIRDSVASLLSEINKDLKNSYEKYVNLSSSLYESKKNECDNLVENYGTEVKRQYSEFTKFKYETVDAVNNQAKEATTQIETSKLEVKEELDNTRIKINEFVDSKKVEFEQLLSKQAEEFTEEKVKMYAKMKKTIAWTIILSSSLSIALSYIFTQIF